MTEMTLYPADLMAMSVKQLAALPAVQLAEIARHLQEVQSWLDIEQPKLQAAHAVNYDDRARKVRLEAGQDFGVVHFEDGPVRITVDTPKRVTWNQRQLEAIAKRISASGEHVEDFIDITYGVPEARYVSWTPTLQKQFAAARTVEAAPSSFVLSIVQEI